MRSINNVYGLFAVCWLGRYIYVYIFLMFYMTIPSNHFDDKACSVATQEPPTWSISSILTTFIAYVLFVHCLILSPSKPEDEGSLHFVNCHNNMRISIYREKDNFIIPVRVSRADKRGVERPPRCVFVVSFRAITSTRDLYLTINMYIYRYRSYSWSVVWLSDTVKKGGGRPSSKADHVAHITNNKDLEMLGLLHVRKQHNIHIQYKYSVLCTIVYTPRSPSQQRRDPVKNRSH